MLSITENPAFCLEPRPCVGLLGDEAAIRFSPYCLRFVARLDLAPLNVVLRFHPFDRQKYYGSVYDLVSVFVNGRRPWAPLERARLRLVRYGVRALDFDGLVAAFKPVVDGLERSGVIVSDAWKVTGPWEVDQGVCAKGAESIFVEVAEHVRS